MCRPAPLYVLWFRGSWNPAGSLGCAVVQCVRPVPSELGRGEGCRLLVCCLVVWCFVCGAGEGCRLSGFCEIASLVCAEASVPSVATSGCPKRSEGGCPCRSEEGAEPRANPAGWFVVWACAPCLANWCGGGLSPFSVLLGDLAFCMWRGGNMRRGSLHPANNEPPRIRV